MLENLKFQLELAASVDSFDDCGSITKHFIESGNFASIESQLISDWLTKLFEVLPYPLTAVYDPYYVDNVYRDEYYRYYSSKHFSIQRNCGRLILIKGKYTVEDLLLCDEALYSKISADCIGTVVIKPTGSIGRTLIDPRKLTTPVNVKTAKFEISILGRRYTVNAFPFTGQDVEVMTCAEANVWQIIEFLGRRYGEHRVVLPGEMMDYLKNINNGGFLPSEGLTLEQEKDLFMQNGLVPRAYEQFWQLENESSVWKEKGYCEPHADFFYSLLHIYIDSGIPVLVNLRDSEDPRGENHCITCIGHDSHTKSQEQFINSAYGVDKWGENEYNIKVVPFWQPTDRCVLMEDHSLPYQLKSLKELSFAEGEDAIIWSVDNFVVPLHKHVYMPAEDACEIVAKLIRDTQDMILPLLDADKNCVIRVFLTESREFKNSRIRNATDLVEAMYYSLVSYPRYLWVCEYGTPKSCSEGRMIGEFILDATASTAYMDSKGRNTDSVIAVRYAEYVTYRGPNEDKDVTFAPRHLRLGESFKMFDC